MKPINVVLTAVAILASVISVSAQEKYSKVKMYLPSKVDNNVKKFLSLDLEVDHFSQEKNYIIFDISEYQLVNLKNSTYQYEILVDDVADEFKKNNKTADFYSNEQNRVAFEGQGQSVTSIIQTPASFTAGSMSGYYTYTEMITKMDNLVSAFPGIISKVNIGATYEGRTIWGVKISDNVSTDESEAEVLFTGLQHAREAITGTSLIFFMQYLCENYVSNSKVNALVNNREIFIIPCVNVDGYVYNSTTNPSGGGLWRKNRRLNSDGTYGVDLNRNYSIDWGCCSGGSSTKSAETYWGTASFSEPETQAIKTFITSRNFKIGFDQHCYGSYYSLPFGIEANHTLDALDTKFYTYVPALIAKYNGHRAGNSIQTVGYNVAGGIKDWLLLGDIGTGTKGKVYGWTGEAGGVDFWAPTADIIAHSKELCYQNLQIAYVAGGHADIQDLGALGVSSLTGSFGFQVRRIGLENKTITVSLLPLENVQSTGSPVTNITLANFHDTYNGTINYTLPSSLANGARFRYIWQVETDGIIFTDTITKFYNPVSLLNDNMEGSLTDNWSVPNGGSAANKWGFVSGTSLSGTKSLAESMSGNYPASATRYVDYKNTFNLSDATAAFLSFWVRHRAENFNDKLQIQISTNGTTWTPVHGKNTVAESNTTSGGTLSNKPALTGIRENWTREIVDLNAYKGNADVYLRFEFTSDAANSGYAFSEDDGFYIDDVNVIKSTTLTLLPVQFFSFSGMLVNGNEALLNWNAETDDNFSHFEVEKSVDSRTFQSIARVERNQPFSYHDFNLFNGNNYYRIKAVDIDGKAIYTRVITIIYSLNQNIVSVYPNPVKDKMNVSIKTANSDKLSMSISDISGKQVYTEYLSADITLRTFTIDTRKFTPQIYILKLVNSRNEIIGIQKIMKQ